MYIICVWHKETNISFPPSFISFTFYYCHFVLCIIRFLFSLLVFSDFVSVFLCIFPLFSRIFLWILVSFCVPLFISVVYHCFLYLRNGNLPFIVLFKCLREQFGSIFILTVDTIQWKDNLLPLTRIHCWCLVHGKDLLRYCIASVAQWRK